MTLVSVTEKSVKKPYCEYISLANIVAGIVKMVSSYRRFNSLANLFKKSSKLANDWSFS
jgi:hypothetical protein